MTNQEFPQKPEVPLVDLFANHFAVRDANPDDANCIAEDWHATASYARELGYSGEQIDQLAEQGRQLYYGESFK